MASLSDSVFVRFTSPRPTEGLRVEWSSDKKTWIQTISDYNLVKSDFGPWGVEKKMFTPSVLYHRDRFYAVWALNEQVNQFGTSSSEDLCLWKPQDYPYTSSNNENVLAPLLTMEGELFVVTYRTSRGNIYRTTSEDFITWSPSVRVSEMPQGHNNICKVAYIIVSNLTDKVYAQKYHSILEKENTRNDKILFSNLRNVSADIRVMCEDTKDISTDLFGIFFEDINYAADGGLYAELLQNRDFEYSKNDNANWNARTAWRLSGNNTEWSIEHAYPLHKNNLHYARLMTNAPGAKLVNEGYNGIVLKANARYNFSIFLKGKGKARISLVSGGNELASTVIKATKEWKQQKAVLVPNADAMDAELCIEPLQPGELCVDFVSLFPQDTYKRRKNGMRRDLAELLAEMKPSFIRFPGGCVTHGQGIDNIYHWHHTIGDLWERKQDINIWKYHQSRGLGFYEYFQFCEDLGAEPLPVLAAGVPCQNSSRGGYGQQGGIPWAKDAMPGELAMEEYLKEILNLIEWANGDPKNSIWAMKRAKAGHPKPFNLKYIGIGNEDLISEVFLERYNYLIENIKKNYPDITIIGTVGPFYKGSDYEYGWKEARDRGIEIVDEHYYNPIGWYLNNPNFYDNYDRNGTKVYLGEWASKGNRLENALAEALYITNIERNADVVVMSSYAPLFGKDGHCQWNPNLIYFNNNSVKPTCNYYVQQLCAANCGDKYIYSEQNFDCAVNNEKNDATIGEIKKRFGFSCVRDSKTGDIIVKMVNMLPVEMKVTMCGLPTTKNGNNPLQAIRYTLKGNPMEQWQQPTSVSATAAELLAEPLSPYSFTLIRIKER